MRLPTDYKKTIIIAFALVTVLMLVGAMARLFALVHTEQQLRALQPLLRHNAMREDPDAGAALTRLLADKDWPTRFSAFAGRVSHDEAATLLSHLPTIASMTQKDITLDIAQHFQKEYDHLFWNIDIDVAASLSTCRAVKFFEDLLFDTSVSPSFRRIAAIRVDAAALSEEQRNCPFGTQELEILASSEDESPELRVFAIHTLQVLGALNDESKLRRWLTHIAKSRNELELLAGRLHDEMMEDLPGE